MKFVVRADLAFPAWKETLTFMVDGVAVGAIAIGSFREIQIALTKPYVVAGELYNVGFRPPMICVQASMLARREKLISLGLTEIDDCQNMATKIYRLHKTRLAMAEKIEKVENEYLETRKDELDKSTEAVSIAVGNLEKSRGHLRQQLEVQLITLVQFRFLVGKLKRIMRLAKKTLSALESNIEINLDYLIFLMVRDECDQEISAYLPLKV